ncbi:MAG: ANTAR domain-containing response regulator [Gammaproteobacteria bacterium]
MGMAIDIECEPRARAGRLRLLLIDDRPQRATRIETTLHQAGHTIAASLGTGIDLRDAVACVSPDAVVVHVDCDTRALLARIAALNREHPCPIVLFTAEAVEPLADAAAAAGVSVLGGGELLPGMIPATLDTALRRFEHFDALCRELDAARTQILERQAIERARALIMEQRGIDADAALAALWALAGGRRAGLVALARRLLAESTPREGGALRSA